LFKYKKYSYAGYAGEKYAKQFLHKSADKEFDKKLIRGKPPKITIHLLFALTPPKILLEI
jgi:hypothetical protein